ncbi:MAG: glutamate--cysteine ligase, partial [Rhizobiales bacterium]|nr:glutamate--cysteine ligase [Hyphomicrobiales bacterium]
SRRGLAARNQLNSDGHDEAVHLQPLEEIVASGQTLAERLLHECRTEWNGDIGEVFRRHAY